MSALPWLVLASIAVLLALLLRGRVSPVLLFPAWAGGYHLAGLIDQRQLLDSVANPALAVLVFLMLVSLVLERAPILERVADALLRGKRFSATLRLSLAGAFFSAFLNNTAVVGTLLGAVTRQRHHSASRLLLPLSYAAILGGVTTLVGTSTNLVVNSFVIAAGLPPLEMFDFVWVGLPVALVCIGVLAFSSRRLPDRGRGEEGKGQRYFLEAQVTASSPLVGKSIEQNRLRNLEGLYLVEIVRGTRLLSPVGPDEVLQADDMLIFAGEVERVQTLDQFPGLKVFGLRADTLLRSNLVEVVIASTSELPNKTLRELDFRTMFDAGVVAIRRGDKPLTGQLGRIALRTGDALLLAAGPDFSQHRNLDRNFHVLGGNPLRPRLTPAQSRIALGGFAAVVAASALGVLPLLAGLMLLMALLMARGILTVGEMRRRFPFELVILIGSALAIARVLDSSGAAALVAGGLRELTSSAGVWVALAGIYLLTAILTELVSNTAAAALSFPLGLSTAQAFGVDPMPFVMVVAYGASACFLTPFGYQTHLMIYSPGRYRLLDFLRTGAPVSITYAALVLALVPLFFPF